MAAAIAARLLISGSRIRFAASTTTFPASAAPLSAAILAMASPGTANTTTSAAASASPTGITAAPPGPSPEPAREPKTTSCPAARHRVPSAPPTLPVPTTAIFIPAPWGIVLMPSAYSCVEVRGVVVAADDPPLGSDHEPGDRGVLCTGERERPRGGRERERLTDDAAMGESRDTLAGMARRDPLDGRADVAGERLGGLGAWDHIPALFGHHPQRDRMTLGDVLAEHAAFPLAEVHLPEPGVHSRSQAEFVRQRGSSLRGAAHRGHVDRVNAAFGQPAADLTGLLLPLGRQRRVALAVDEVEESAVDVGLRLPVPDKQQVGRAWRRLEGALPERRWLWFCFGTRCIRHEAEPIVSGTAAA